VSRLGLRGFILFGIAGASFVAMGVGVLTRPASPLPSDAPHLSTETLNRQRLRQALLDASLKGLIQNARVAAHKGDEKTRTAMVSGLRKDPDRARDLLHQELSRTMNSKDLAILNRILTELP
jgi:hypothetical protein